jgi:hypothetical protein
MEDFAAAPGLRATAPRPACRRAIVLNFQFLGTQTYSKGVETLCINNQHDTGVFTVVIKSSTTK